MFEVMDRANMLREHANSAFEGHSVIESNDSLKEKYEAVFESLNNLYNAAAELVFKSQDKIEVGRIYKTRGGDKACIGLVYDKEGSGYDYPILGHIYSVNGTIVATWTKDGIFLKGTESIKDIVGEWDVPERENMQQKSEMFLKVTEGAIQGLGVKEVVKEEKEIMAKDSVEESRKFEDALRFVSRFDVEILNYGNTSSKYVRCTAVCKNESKFVGEYFIPSLEYALRDADGRLALVNEVTQKAKGIALTKLEESLAFFNAELNKGKHDAAS